MEQKELRLIKTAKSFGAGIFQGFAVGVKHEGTTEVRDVDGKGPKVYFERSFCILIFIFILKFGTLYRPEGYED